MYLAIIGSMMIDEGGELGRRDYYRITCIPRSVSVTSYCRTTTMLAAPARAGLCQKRKRHRHRRIGAIGARPPGILFTQRPA